MLTPYHPNGFAHELAKRWISGVPRLLAVHNEANARPQVPRIGILTKFDVGGDVKCHGCYLRSFVRKSAKEIMVMSAWCLSAKRWRSPETTNSTCAATAQNRRRLTDVLDRFPDCVSRPINLCLEHSGSFGENGD